MKFKQQRFSPQSSSLKVSRKNSLFKQRIKKQWLMRGVLLAATMPVGVSPSLLQPVLSTARADFYHAVEPGETLKSIATRYGLTAETLQTVNHLEGTKDTAGLPAMLLQVPGNKKGDKNERKTNFTNTLADATSNFNPAIAEAIPSGTIAQSVRYTIQSGDSVESIAERYAQGGYPVTADEIRQKNRLSGQPRIGSTIIVPLQSATYRASAQQRRGQSQVSGGRSLGGSITSEDAVMPTVQVVPDNQPVYQSIADDAKNSSRSTSRGRRGPSSLASRGGYSPRSSREGVRVLPQNEDAPNTGEAPRPKPRVVQTPTQTVPASSLANVAQIKSTGARIRRLPDASAATLYNCPVGTELAVTKQNGSWSAILMSDRSTGWIPTRYLKFTGVQVDIASQVVTGSAAMNNRPNYGSTYNYNGNYGGNSPMVIQALKWLGTPYVYGGTSRRGIDCSSLVQQSFRACGYRLPRTAAEQARVGQNIHASQLQAGDRLYFSASGTRIDHTGLYMGNGQFVHASGRGRSVIVSNLFDSAHWNIFVCARR